MPVRYPFDVADIGPDETEIVVVGTAGQKITNLGPDFSTCTAAEEIVVVGGESAAGDVQQQQQKRRRRINPQLKQLVLRSHLIRIMEGLDDLPFLELLELYDNQVSELRCLEGKSRLRVLDMSYNVVREMQPVRCCENLQELCACTMHLLYLCTAFAAGLRERAWTVFSHMSILLFLFPVRILFGFLRPPDLANNKIKSLGGLCGLHKLRKLDLGANRIRVMDAAELDGLTSLEELWLGKNKIEKIEGLTKLTVRSLVARADTYFLHSE